MSSKMTQKQAHKLIRSFLMLLVILAPAASAQQVYEVDGTPGYNWGILISKDDGQTWEQRVIESGLRIDEWPTEPSVVVYGDVALGC